jgi:hypothetical protein
MSDQDQDIQFPSAESAKMMESKEAAIGAELIYLHNSVVAILNDLIAKHNERVEGGESIEDKEGVSAVGAANAFAFVIELLQTRIREYIKDFDVTIGTDGEPGISAELAD